MTKPPSLSAVELILKMVLALIDAAKAIIPAILVGKVKDAETAASTERAKAMLAEAETQGLKNAQKVDHELAGLSKRDRFDKLITRFRKRRSKQTADDSAKH